MVHISWIVFIATSVGFFPTSEGARSSIDQCNANGQHFLIATSDSNPYMIIQHKGTNISKVDGFVHQIVIWMAEKCNFTFEYVQSPDEAYGTFENESWNGMVGMLARGEVQIVAADLTITYPRSLVVEFTTPFSYDPQVLMIPYPELDSTINRIVKPFQFEVWGFFFFSLIVASRFLFFISWMESRQVVPRRQQSPGWFTYFHFLFRVDLANPSKIISFSLTTRLVVAAWCLAGIVLVNTYTSSLVSYLMAPKFVPLINTLQDLADSHELKITVRKATSQYSLLMDAKSGPLAKIADSLRDHPENVMLVDQDMPNKVYNQHLAFPLEETSIKVMIYDDYKNTGKCRAFIAKEPFYPNQCAFATHKSDPMAKILSDELNWLFQVGLLNRWIKSYSPPPYRCSAPLSTERSKKNKKLSLNYLSGAFLLYAVGIVASVVAFLLECLIAWWSNKTRTKVRLTTIEQDPIQPIT